ncbi:MAG: M23 family metallopeptidase, partial [Phycisphaerae bacterium]
MRETPGRARNRLARATLPWILVTWGCTGIGGEGPPPPPPADDAEAYYLPFEAGTARTVGQGNFGVAGLGSHADNYAIDFIMPADTPVLAARRGVVVDVRADCPDVNCPFDPERCCGNFVRVRHDDGTTAIY